MSKPKKQTHYVVIIGAGPAGVAASIQLKRYGVPFCVFERERVGGLLNNANWVENYPGFPDGISGRELVALFKQQIEFLGVEVIFESVARLDFDGGQWVVDTRQALYYARIAIVASGTKPKSLPMKVAPSASSRIFTDVYPLFGVRQAHIVIVGAGDAAFDHALNLVINKNSVTVLNRGSEVKCLPLLWKRASAEAGIRYQDKVTVNQVETSTTGGKLAIHYEAAGRVESLEADYLVSAIGREPQLDFLSEKVYQQRQMLEGTGRLFFIGDVHNGLFRQTAIACGEGLRVAMQIYQDYLEKR